MDPRPGCTPVGALQAEELDLAEAGISEELGLAEADAGGGAALTGERVQGWVAP